MSRARLARLFLALAAVAFALAAYGFLPRAGGTGTRAPLDVVLLDASASEARAHAWLPWARAELAAAARSSATRGHELAVVVYAEAPVTAAAPGPPAEFLARLAGERGEPFDPRAGLAGSATRLDEALAAVEPWCLAASRPRGELLLLARPGFTGASPEASLARLTAGGVTLARRAPPPADENDLVLEELVLPARVEVGAPLVARLVGRLVPGRVPARAAELVLRLSGASEDARFTRTVALPPGGGPFEVALALGPASAGRTRVELAGRLAEGHDPWPESNTLVAATLAEGLRLCVVAVASEQEAAARAWLAPSGRSALSGLQFDFVAPGELVGELQHAAALVSFDLGPRELPGGAVRAFVQSGGGWLAVSGWRFKRDWLPGVAPAPLSELLPMEPREGRPEPRDVVLLIDGSGSMESAFEVVRAAALELVRAALPEDRVSLRFFTTGLEREVVLKERSATRVEDEEAAARAARELLALRVPSGTTYLFAALQQLARELSAPASLVFLLSDGRDRDPLTLEGAARAAAAALAAARARLVVVGVGELDEPVLAELAGGLERVQRGQGLAELSALFQRELHGSEVVEGELALSLAARASGSLADEVASAALALAAPPPIERFLRNRLRPLGEVLWLAPEGEPVLALTRAGLGRTALLATRPGGDWARRHARAGLGEPAEYEGLLRWLARGPQDAGARARCVGTRLELTGLAPETPAELVVRLEPEGRALRLTPPAELGRDPWRTRTCELGEAPGPEAWLVLAEGAEERVVTLERGPVPEFLRREQEVPAAWWTGVAGPAAGPVGRGARGWALSVLGLALGLLLAGAGLRITSPAP